MKNDFLLQIATVLRLLPYLFVIYIAFIKGYKWLVGVVTISIVAVFIKLTTGSLNLDTTTSTIIASITAFCLVMHVLQLKEKR